MSDENTPDPTRLDGRIVLVTGGTRGIGLAVSRELARAGATVVMNYRSDLEQAKAALETVRAVRPDASLLAADVGVPAEVEGMFRTLRADHGRLDGLVNNAGIAADGYALMMGDAKWNKVIDTNLTGAFGCLRAAGRLMARERRGAIVAVASTSGIAPPAGQVNYAASKAGLLASVRVMAKELGSYGVRVNAVVPGFVATAMTRSMDAKALAAHLQHVPLGRIGEGEDVAPAVRYLLSDASAYVTGASLVIDGGLTA